MWIIPAYAGSTPTAGASDGAIDGSSPHTRGAPYEYVPAWLEARIIPAYAGSTSSSTSPARRRSDHPRIRGEHAGRGVGEPFGAGSSPHTRGALSRGTNAPDLMGIIPAYAGSTRFVAQKGSGA